MAPLVLVTRPLEQAKDFATHLTDIGYEPLLCPLLTIQSVACSLPSVDRFDAVVVTSQQVFSVSHDYTPLKDLPIYCVGDVTSDSARKSGFSDVICGGQTVEELSVTLKGTLARTSRVLYVRGEDVRQDPTCLCPDFFWTELIVYRAVLAENFPEDVVKRFPEIDVVTLFSARTGRCFAELVRKNNLVSHISHIKLLSLSEAVLQSVSDLNWQDAYCTCQPDMKSMLDKLKVIA